MNALVLKFDRSGAGHCLYSELIDLTAVGPLAIRRATTIEFNPNQQQWEVRNPQGQVLHSHRSRVLCLAWEQQHFNH
jgi:hypothetical protein